LIPDEREYLLSPEVGVRIRCFHRTEKGQIVAFTVQLEIEHEGRWQPVIRYDTAHGFTHCDRYRRNGSVVKTELNLPYSEARTFAEVDIRKHWREYRRYFLGEG